MRRLCCAERLETSHHFEKEFVAKYTRLEGVRWTGRGGGENRPLLTSRILRGPVLDHAQSVEISGSAVELPVDPHKQVLGPERRLGTLEGSQTYVILVKTKASRNKEARERLSQGPQVC